jgi:hypothetical protein
MYYLVYKITNSENNKYYVGAHKTLDKNDGYMGSGKYLKRAIEKYGEECFKKEILHECDTESEMWEKEKELVEIGSHTYNLKEGGFGGFDHVNIPEFREKKRIAGLKGSMALKKKLLNPEFKTAFCEKQSTLHKERFLKHPEQFSHLRYDWTGKTHKESSIKKMKETHSKNEHQKGSKNSMYGKMWITNGSESTRIMKNELIPHGWQKGRCKGRG